MAKTPSSRGRVQSFSTFMFTSSPNGFIFLCMNRIRVKAIREIAFTPSIVWVVVCCVDFCKCWLFLAFAFRLHEVKQKVKANYCISFTL